MDQQTPDWVNVSRETLDDLQAFHDLVLKWTPRINLVSAKAQKDLWSRHIWDSWQILEHIQVDRVKHWVDIGSGGGFPGIVCAIALKSTNFTGDFSLIESDARKSQFLRTCSREIGLNVEVINKRIEVADIIGCDLVTARALAPLTQLLEMSDPLLDDSGALIAMKGANYQIEIEDARQKWRFDCVSHASKTDPDAAILKIGSISYA
ncbi:16S rRNA (guanine(527)-N(7))-methyltransferase RsmG [Algirhabdus cladophorae]|uniref:16S rRNA (guanine(527)-N(7))-methyltransferase RsmG n=1 Tax=Algirhabdus cladophorae TaxID=3377108 RepID=UPI003B847923